MHSLLKNLQIKGLMQDVVAGMVVFLAALPLCLGIVGIKCAG
jgi:MFS superfamily sulfate permease-like transporter